MLRYDAVTLDSAEIKENGFIYDRPILTRAGVFVYRQPDGTTRREYRPPEEVFHPEHLKSIRGKPITDMHNGLARADSDYIIGTTLSEGIDERPNLRGDIVIHHPKKLGSKREVSLGYRMDLELVSGTTPEGEPYDAIQRNMRVDHLAVVPRGRAGNARLRMDSADAASMPFDLEDSSLPDPTVKLVSVRLDSGLEYQASPEVAREIDKLKQDAVNVRDEVKAEKTRADGVTAERDTLKAELAKMKEEVSKAFLEGAAHARSRLELENVAKSHGVEVKQDMKDRDIREAVVKKLAPDEYKFDGMEDVYVQVAFDSTTARVNKAKQNGQDNITTVVQAVAGAQRADSAPSPVIRSSADFRRAVGVAR